MTTFRHHCPPEVNPKHITVSPSDPELDARIKQIAKERALAEVEPGDPPLTEVSVRNPDYRANIRREYEVTDDAQWYPLFSATDPGAKMGLLEPSGREMAVVPCPDCGVEVVVTREV